MWWMWCMLSWAQVATVDGVPIADSDFAIEARQRARFGTFNLSDRRRLVDDLIDERLFATRALDTALQYEPAIRLLIEREYLRIFVLDDSMPATEDELRAWWSEHRDELEFLPGESRNFEDRRGTVSQLVAAQGVERRHQATLARLRKRAVVTVDKRFVRSFGPMPYKVKIAKLQGPIALISGDPVQVLPPPPQSMPGSLPMLEPERLAAYIDEQVLLRAAMEQPLIKLPGVRRALADAWVQEELERRVPERDEVPKIAREQIEQALSDMRSEVRAGVSIIVDERYLMRVPFRVGGAGVPRP